MVARYGAQGGLGYWLTGEPLPKAMGLPLVGEPTRLHEAGRRNTFRKFWVVAVRGVHHACFLGVSPGCGRIGEARNMFREKWTLERRGGPAAFARTARNVNSRSLAA